MQDHLTTYPLPPPPFSARLSLSCSVRRKERALICQSEQPFHTVSLCSTPVPQRELLISPGWLAYSRLVGSPHREQRDRVGAGAGIEALVRAWQVADKSSSRCSCMNSPLPLELGCSHTKTHTRGFSTQMWGTNNNLGILGESAVFPQARIKVKHGAFIESEFTNCGIPRTEH